MEEATKEIHVGRLRVRERSHGIGAKEKSEHRARAVRGERHATSRRDATQSLHQSPGAPGNRVVQLRGEYSERREASCHRQWIPRQRASLIHRSTRCNELHEITTS